MRKINYKSKTKSKIVRTKTYVRKNPSQIIPPSDYPDYTIEQFMETSNYNESGEGGEEII